MLATLALTVSGLCSGLLFAQGITTGTILGTVVDPQGAVIPAATIRATNTATGATLTTESLGDGMFSFRFVPIGDYTLDINATGFQTGAIPSVIVVSGVTTDLKSVRLGITTATTVVVTGNTTPLLQVADSQVSTVFDSKTIQSLPLNNSFDTIAEVIPGVASTHADFFSNSNGDNFSVNGQSGRFNNFQFDGQSNNDNSTGGTQIYFGNQDALAQIQVITNDYSAQYGRNSGAVVNYITKSGTNAFHGSAFEIYQGSFLSSLENQQKTSLFGFCAPGENPSSGCTKPVVPRSSENRFGATLGGPILRNKLFFFGSTYWDRKRTSASPSTSLGLTPTPAGLAALAAAFPGNASVEALQKFGPYAISEGNPSAVNSSIQTMDVTGPGGVTATAVPFSFVQRFVAAPYDDQEHLGRLDWQPTDKDHMFARYFYQSLGQQAYGGDIASGNYVNSDDKVHTIGADWTHTFSPHWADQLRYSFQQATVAYQDGGLPNCTISSPDNCPAEMGIGNGFESFGLQNGYPQGRVMKVTQIQNNATWTRGKHTILFGGEIDLQNSPQTGLANYAGSFSYSDFDTFISNAPGPNQPNYDAELALAFGNITTKYKETDLAGYIQDNWQVTPNLTAHIGLRWEYFSPAFNVLHDLTVARESNPATAIWDPTLPLTDRTFPKMQQFRKGFEPRIGIAWNPAFDSKMVIKAGYAINRNPAFYNLATMSAALAPVANAGTIFCTGGSTCLPSGGDIRAGSVRSLNASLLPTGGDPRILDQITIPSNLKPPYTQTYTLAMDHQLGRAAVGEVRYVGSLTQKNFQAVDANPYLLPVQTDFPSFAPVTLCSDLNAVGYGRPDCNYGNVEKIGNGGWANYNGLQFNLTTRNLHGFTGTVSYTYSKTLDNATDVASTYAGGSSLAFAQNPLDTSAAERGVSGNSFTHALGAQFSYEVPALAKGGAMLARMTGGFVLSGFYRYDSGQPYTPFQPIGLDSYTPDVSYCDAAFNSSSIGPGVDTCRMVRSNKNAPLSSVAYLNPYTGPVGPGGPTLGTPEYVIYGSDSATYDGSGNFLTYDPGTPIDPHSAHWIINNMAYAQSVQNPYPGSSRNIEHGDNFSELDLSIAKNVKLTERVTMQLSMAAYNVLNQMYRGTPQTYAGNTSNFGSYDYSSGSNIPGNTSPSGTRFVLLGGKVIF